MSDNTRTSSTIIDHAPFDKNEGQVKSDMQAVIDHVRASGELRSLPYAPGAIFVPGATGYSVHDVREFLSTPMCASGTTSVFTPSDFKRAFLARGATAETSAVYVNDSPATPAIVGIVDHGSAGSPAWRRERVSVEFRTTPEWDRMKSMNGRLMDPITFANFIEDHSKQFVKPTGAELMEIVQNFEVKSDLVCRQVARIENGGVQIHFNDDPQGSVKGGTITIPQTFDVSVRPFQGGTNFIIEAAFRWKRDGASIAFGFKFLRIEDCIRKAVEEMVEQISDDGFPIPIYSGIAPGVTRP